MPCHGEPSAARPALLAEYGREDGFNWRAGDVVGAQITNVTTAVPMALARRAFKASVISVCSVVSPFFSRCRHARQRPDLFYLTRPKAEFKPFRASNGVRKLLLGTRH